MAAKSQAQKIYVSGSVQRTVDNGGTSPVSANEIVRDLLRLHPEYGENSGQHVILSDDPDQPRKMFDDWLLEVSKLYEDKEQPINGRLLILGLALQNPDLRAELEEGNFFDTLLKEYRPPYRNVLTAEGKEILEQLSTSSIFQSDRARLQMDNRAIQDKLGRQPYATALGLQIRYLRNEQIDKHFEKKAKQKEDPNFTSTSDPDPDLSLLLHLYGPWGSGKSSLLYLLQEHLKENLQQVGKDNEYEGLNQQPWIVINFNAWQHQRGDPPWWVLMDTVFNQSRDQLKTLEIEKKIPKGSGRSKELWLKEQAWRLSTAISPRLISTIILTVFILLIILIVLFLSLRVNLVNETWPTNLSDWEKVMTGAIGLITTLAATAFIVTRSLFPGTTQAAQYFVDMTRNPMTRLSDHFTKMIRWVGLPVVVLIDDLDRCDQEYVTKLLENIQTLFRKAPVIYVVAADKGWLTASYEDAYANYSQAVGQPGVPLGHLFLEKIFQLSIPVPGIQRYYRERFLSDLLEEDHENLTDLDEKRMDQLYEVAREDLRQVDLDSEIMDKIQEIEQDTLEAHVYRAEAIKRLVLPGVRKKTENRLKEGYRDLIGDNPRAMKRMINTYMIHQQLVTLSGEDISPEDLPLWSILVTRWPTLANYLGQNPEVLVYFELPEAKLPDNVPEHLRPLFSDTDVQKVLQGAGISDALIADPQKIETLARLSI